MTPQNHLLPNRIYRFLAVNLMLLGLSVPLLKAQVQFSSPKNYPVGTKPVAAAVADFNGDGKQDLVVVNSGSGDVSILLGKGDGTFDAAVNYSVGGTSSSPISPTFVAVGDFNGDHKLDLAVANGCANTVSILLGNGDGTFQAPEQFPAGTSASYIAVGDFNGDGKPDLVVSSGGSSGSVSTVSILLGNGDATFQSPVITSIPVPATSRGYISPVIALGDFNGDDKLDVAAGERSGQSADTGIYSILAILLGNGDGTFQPATTSSLGNTWGGSEAATAADFNGDGKLDLAVATQSGIAILLGHGDGTFSSSSSPYGPASATNSVAVADLNQNGKLDVVGLTGSYGIQWILGNGNGTFQSGCPQWPACIQLTYVPSWLAVGDFNGDNLRDLVVANSSGNNVSIFLNISSDFSLSASPTSATVTAGGSATYTLSIKPADGFNHTVALSCAGAPAEATCGISPESVTLDGTAAATATLTLTTTARSSAPPLPWAKPKIPGKQWIVAWIALLAGLMPLAIVAPLSRQHAALLRPVRGLALATTILLVGLWAACGGTGASHSPGTPAGTYSLTLTGSSGSLSHSTSVTVTVNP